MNKIQQNKKLTRDRSFNMRKQSLLLGLITSGLIVNPALAQTAQSQFDPSSFIPFQEQNNVILNPTVYSTPQATVNGLAPTSLDSFVYEAGGNAELIYGDEGQDGLPPYYGFDVSHRINAGITGQRAAGLTTGHGSYLPDAWGGDEFTGNEWSMSGAAGNPTALALQALMGMMGLGSAAAATAANAVGAAANATSAIGNLINGTANTAANAANAAADTATAIAQDENQVSQSVNNIMDSQAAVAAIGNRAGDQAIDQAISQAPSAYTGNITNVPNTASPAAQAAAAEAKTDLSVGKALNSGF